MRLRRGLLNALYEASHWHPSGGFPACYRKATMSELSELGMVVIGKGKTSMGNPTDVWLLTRRGRIALAVAGLVEIKCRRKDRRLIDEG